MLYQANPTCELIQATNLVHQLFFARTTAVSQSRSPCDGSGSPITLSERMLPLRLREPYNFVGAHAPAPIPGAL